MTDLSAPVAVGASARWREIALDICCVILVLAPFLRLWMPRASGPIDLRYDAGVYYILGTSIYEGQGYRLLNEPGKIPANQYPPLLPLIVAAHQWALGTSDPAVVGPWLRFSFFLFSSGFLAAAYFLAKRYLGRVLGVLAGLICALHVDTVFFSDLCFAEIPFGLVTLVFFLIQGRWGKWGQGAQAVLGVAAFLLRTMGLALLGAWVIEALLARQWARAAIRAGVALVPLLLWQGYVAHVRASELYAHPAYVYQRAAYLNYNVSYGENMSLIDPFIPELGRHTLRTHVRQIAGNCLDMVPTMGEMVSSRRMYWWFTLDQLGTKLGSPGLNRYYAWPSVPLGILVWIGLGTMAFKRQWLATFYVLGTIGMICLTPWPNQFTRYLVPVIPFLAIGLFQGLRAIWNFRWAAFRSAAAGKSLPTVGRWAGVRRIAGWALVVGVAGIVLAAQFYSLRKMHERMRGTATYPNADGTRRPYGLFYCDSAWSSFEDAMTWLKANANRSDIVVTTAPHWTYLWTGLTTAQPPYESDQAEELRQLATVGATYVILDAFDYPGGDVTRRYAEPAVQGHPEAWELVYTTRDRPVRIYRRHG